MSKPTANVELSGQFEELLINNGLPLPGYYNGHDWNTIISGSRKAMPSYLQEDLPPLKYHYIREQFKAINKIQCPRLTYFQNKIASNKFTKGTGHCQGQCSRRKRERSVPHLGSLPGDNRVRKNSVVQSLKGQIRHLQSSLQFALMTSERRSNVVNQLIEQANSMEEQLSYRLLELRKSRKGEHFVSRDDEIEKTLLMEKHKKRSFREEIQEDRCFQDTIQLVIQARKHHFNSNIQQQHHKTTHNHLNHSSGSDHHSSMTDSERNAYHSQKQGKHGELEAVARKIGSIQLLPFSSFDDSDPVSYSHSQKPSFGEKEE